MALMDLLLSCAEGIGNQGNQGNAALVTGKTFIEQSGNRRNHGNQENWEGEGENAEPGDGPTPSPESTHATTIESGYLVTLVTSLETKGNSGNQGEEGLVTAVTALKTKEKPDGGPPEVVEGDEAAHDLWLAGAPIAGLDHCRFCGERISWRTDGTAFADGNAAHNRCYEAELRARRRWC